MHKNADLDALASACYLRGIYEDSIIIAHGLDRYAKNAARMLNVEVLDYVPNEYDEVITVDTASIEQLGEFGTLEIDKVYDHHESNNIDAPERFVDPTYPSCSELVYDLFRKVPERQCALLLIAGIISDTQWFKYANSRTFKIVHEIMDAHAISMRDVRPLIELPVNFGERISVLKGYQRLIYRSVGDKIVIATRVSANESTVATQLLSFADVVFVGSSRKGNIRITGRSRRLNLLEVFEELALDFSCTFGGHRNAAGMSCIGDLEAILNAAVKVVCARFER